MTFRRIFVVQSAGLALLLVQAASTSAQTCFAYSDGCSHPGWNLPGQHPQCVNAPVPIRCVEESDLNQDCSWDSDCHSDGNPATVCCTTVPAAGPQSYLEMHEEWHDCFGAVGRNDGANPPGRGQRWYAFHRQFEFDFNLWRDQVGFLPIESLEWCPSMNLPLGHPSVLAVGQHPSNCGTNRDALGIPVFTGIPRPANRTCNDCIAFPQCLFLSGAGPGACPTAPSATCQAGSGGVIYPYNSLDEFQDVEEVTTILDAQFHGAMHGAVDTADGGNYVSDVSASACSPRDPMFWRLHKALDDVVRAWQDNKAVDVILVIDRSGSMSAPDPSGQSKLDAALDAVDNFADLLEHSRSDGQQNRVGIVSYSSGATLDLPLTVADVNLRNPGGPFDQALSSIASQGPGGCTGIGGAIDRALDELCPPNGDCQGHTTVAGANARRAILVLTDGLENRPPCLQPAGPTPSGACGSQCSGAAFDYSNMEFTQAVAVGFGNAASLNGDLLTLLTERQGGIYLQNPATPGDDLKNFFVKAFGQLTDEFLLFDPSGRLLASDPVSDRVEFSSCGDNKLTFSAGWDQDVVPGELRLLVTAPSGDLVNTSRSEVQHAAERLWSHTRLSLPHRGDDAGTWQAELARPHSVFINGFTPDGFAVLEEGVGIIRRQIQRLCPEGCRNVLLFESGLTAPSAYRAAVEREVATELLGQPEVAGTERQFARQLQRRRWDLVVYARVGPERSEPFDSVLAERLCADQRAIVTETRRSAQGHVLECLGVRFAREDRRGTAIEGDGRLFDGVIRLTNPGHQVSSVSFRSALTTQARFVDGGGAAILVKAARGREQQWFVNVLGQGLTKVVPVRLRSQWRTSEPILVAARIPPSYFRAGGYDHVDARVEVEYPIQSLGTLLSGVRGEARDARGETLSPQAQQLLSTSIETQTATFALYDDGTHGDQHAGNAYWTTTLDGLGRHDGTYKLRFIFDLTADGCTTRREVAHSISVGVGVDSRASVVEIVGSEQLAQGRTRSTLRVRPADRFGNLLGPGKANAAARSGNRAAGDAGEVSCGPESECRIEGQRIADDGGGWYRVDLITASGVGGVRLRAFGSRFDVPLPCSECPELLAVVADGAIEEHASLTGRIRLEGAAPRSGAGGAVVYLESSDPRLANVPSWVIVPAGRVETTFPIQAQHLVGRAPQKVTVSAVYAGVERSRPITVLPARR